MNILLISMNWSGLVSPIVREMRNQGHQVTMLDNSDIAHFEYVSKAERIVNLFCKTFLRSNLKRLRKRQLISRYLQGFCVDRHYDLTIVNNPDIFQLHDLELIKSISERLVCHLWDSVDKHPKNIEHRAIYDKVFSFDPLDIRDYGFEPVTNYLDTAIPQLSAERQTVGDLFAIQSYDRYRYQLLVALLDANPNLRCRFIVYIHHPRRRRYATDPRIELIETPIPTIEGLAIAKDYRAVLDVGHTTQRGISFRVFEATAARQKLVTTNEEVRRYPFYNASNIWCLDVNNPVIDAGFFDMAYSPVTPAALQPYEIGPWVADLLARMSA